MKPIDPETLLSALRWRYATKKFDPTKTISEPTWQALEEALVLTPSSYGLQPWKFFVVTNREIREKLVEASWKQRQVIECSHHVVFAIKKEMAAADVERFVQRIIEVRATPAAALDGYKKIMLNFVTQSPAKVDLKHWASLQVYIALGNFMTSAAVLGIDTCPMEGIEPAKYDEILGLEKKGYQTIVACAAGYRSEQDKAASLAKVRFQLEEVVEKIS